MKQLSMILFILVAFSILPLPGFAQLEGSLVMSLSPRLPKPNTTVAASLSTISGDLSRATIRWYENDKLISSGIGLTKQSISLGRDGSVIRIRAAATLIDGRVLEANATIRPQIIVLVWSAETTVPTWYPGRPLPTPESTVMFSAIPSIAINSGFTAKDLLYTWFIGNTDAIHAKGVGLQQISIKMPKNPSTGLRVKVVVENRSGAYTAEESETLYSDAAEELLYVVGASGEIIRYLSPEEVSIAGGETVSILSESFNYSRGIELTHEWKVNGKKIKNDLGRSSFFTLRLPSEKSTHSVTNLVTAANRTFQRALGAITFKIE